MTTEPTEIRLARLEGACEQMNIRLKTMEQQLAGQTGTAYNSFGSVSRDPGGEMRLIRQEFEAFRREMTLQFHVLMILLSLSIIIPILRDLAR